MQRNRPKYLDIKRIHLPIPGIVSILHRVTSIAIFVGLPFFLWLLSGSLSTKESFEIYQSVVSFPLVKLILIGFLWAFLHHSIAGIRFLLLDAHIGIELTQARLSAKFVATIPVMLTVVIGVLLW